MSVARSSGEVRADLTSADGAKDAVAAVIAEHGRIDVLAHVMGGFAGGTPVQETDDATWSRMMDMNLNAAFRVFREALPHMIAARRGRIVAVGSRAGLLPAVGLSAYAVSKAGLQALVQAVAEEVKDYGVTANVVLPSTMDTAANRSWGTPVEAAAWVKPESVAELIFWLASEAAGDVNGALVPIYGRT